MCVVRKVEDGTVVGGVYVSLGQLAPAPVHVGGMNLDGGNAT